MLNFGESVTEYEVVCCRLSIVNGDDVAAVSTNIFVNVIVCTQRNFIEKKYGNISFCARMHSYHIVSYRIRSWVD